MIDMRSSIAGILFPAETGRSLELRYDQENEHSDLREGETNLALPCL